MANAAVGAALGHEPRETGESPLQTVQTGMLSFREGVDYKLTAFCTQHPCQAPEIQSSQVTFADVINLVFAFCLLLPLHENCIYLTLSPDSSFRISICTVL